MVGLDLLARVVACTSHLSSVVLELRKILVEICSQALFLADADCVKHSHAENGVKYLGLATLIALVAIRHVAERIAHASRIASQTIRQGRARLLKPY